VIVIWYGLRFCYNSSCSLDKLKYWDGPLTKMNLDDLPKNDFWKMQACVSELGFEFNHRDSKITILAKFLFLKTKFYKNLICGLKLAL